MIGRQPDKHVTFYRERPQIEEVLGRPLTDMDIVRRESLGDLSPTQRATARVLRRRQLVLCAMYLRMCTPIGAYEASAWISDDENDDKPCRGET